MIVFGTGVNRRASIWAILLGAVSIVLMSSGLYAVSAQETGLCSGDVIIVFPDARLLNVDGQRSAGPFPISLEPGTYLVTAASYDAHGGDQITQPKEQWQMISDSGWSSPFTVDIDDAFQTVVSTFNSQQIASPITSFTVSHLGEDSINSVTPVCAGFTRLADPPAPSTTVPASVAPEDDTDGDPDPDPDAEGSSDGASRDPEDPDDADGSSDGTEGDEEVEPDGVTPTVPTTAVPIQPATTVAPTHPATTAAAVVTTTTSEPVQTTAAPAATADEIEPEVAGAVETAPVLARTGVSPLTNRILGLGMFLIGLGGLVLAINRRERLSF